MLLLTKNLSFKSSQKHCVATADVRRQNGAKIAVLIGVITFMKILIVGTGIIGTIYGWALKNAGHEVFHFVRKGKSGEKNKTFKIDILDERKGFIKNNLTTYDMKAIENITGQHFDLVIIPVNSYQVIDILKEFQCIADDTYFFIMAADWIGISGFEQYIPRNRFILGYPDAGGTIKNDSYWVNIGSEIHIEKRNDNNQKCYDLVIDAFSKANIKPDVQENMLHWLWVHTATSIPLWVAYQKHKNTKTFLKDSKLLDVALAATKEVIVLLKKRGIKVNDYPEINAFALPKPILKFIMKILYTYNKSMQRYTAHAANSFEEAKVLYYEILTTAKELNYEMPMYNELEKYVN